VFALDACGVTAVLCPYRAPAPPRPPPRPLSLHLPPTPQDKAFFTAAAKYVIANEAVFSLQELTTVVMAYRFKDSAVTEDMRMPLLRVAMSSLEARQEEVSVRVWGAWGCGTRLRALGAWLCDASRLCLRRVG
jgi:hypothetical protein